MKKEKYDITGMSCSACSSRTHRRLGAILFVYWRVFQHRQMAAPAGRAAVDGGVSRGRAGGTGRVRGKVVDESGGEIVALLV